jgi:hypothetical protein
MNSYYDLLYFKNANRGYCNAIDFDGSDDAIVISNAAPIQDIFDGGGTVSFWISPNTDGGSNAGRVFDKGTVLGYLSDDNGTAVNFNFNQKFSGDNGAWKTSARLFTLNVYTHCVLTYDNSLTTNNPIFYINGAVKTVGSGITETSTPTVARSSDGGNDLILGNNATPNRPFDGIMDNFKMWDTILTGAQAIQEYDLTRKDTNVVANTDLQGWWKLNDSTSTIVDSSTNSNDGVHNDGGAPASPTNLPGRYRKCR